jgi:high-affinity Fe2+/Pb2+ permease
MNSTKRVLPGAWILVANSFVVGLTITRLSPELSTGELHNFELWIELFLEVLLPVVGIVVELVRWRFAKWVNVGYPLAAALLWLGEAAR